MRAYLPTDGYTKPFYRSTYEIFTDALKNSKFGHEICRRFSNKYVLFYIHWGSLDLHICDICRALYTHPRVSMDFMRTHVESTLSLHGLHEDSVRTRCRVLEDSMDFRGSPWLYFIQST